MPDRVFFPLTLLVAVLLVWLATLPGANSLPTGSVSGAASDYVTIVVEGEQLHRFKPEGHLTRTLIEGQQAPLLELTANEQTFPATANTGPHFRLAPDLEVAFGQKQIRIILRARKSPENGADAFEMNYMAGPGDTSDWQRFTLTDSFADYSFEYLPPNVGTGRNVDFLGIRPLGGGAADNGPLSMQIERLTFLNLGEPENRTARKATNG